MDENPYESPRAPNELEPVRPTLVPARVAYAIIIAFSAVALAIRWLTLPRP